MESQTYEQYWQKQREAYWTCFIPENRMNEARELYKDHEEAWRAFAEKCIKHMVMRSEIISRQNDKCALCGKPIKCMIRKVPLHHLDYKRCCTFDERILVRRDNGHGGRCKIELPNCGKCMTHRKKAFDYCASLLCALCPDCHKYVHVRQQEISNINIKSQVSFPNDF